MNLWLILGAAPKIDEADDGWCGFALYNNFWLETEEEDWDDDCD